ncbi:hypothetical protein AB2B41_06855 [Marimonas sp. MJW-29]|uniref:Uncharacterized protein n=1 Tax=Sulfitobacter sediminis TaxID=3234186 RepID=A0ABV3RK06_9RHOB
MSPWSTYRYVPPIAPEAMIWATLSFGTFLAAQEFRPVLLGSAIDPLALAFAVHLALSFAKNVSSDRFQRVFAAAPREATVLLALIAFGLFCLAAYGSAAFTVTLAVLYFSFHAAVLYLGATRRPDMLPMMVGTWTSSEPSLPRAVQLEAMGILLGAMTLLTVWHFAGQFAFAAMLSFGMLVLRYFVNWIIVLYFFEADDGYDD